MGGGINLSDTSEIMRKLIAYTGIPTVTSLMGLGCVADDDPNYFGMIGMHGTYAGNLSTTETDLLIGLGVRFDDRVTGLLAEFAAKAKIVHFDIDAAEINKNVRSQIKVVGNLAWSLAQLFDKVQKRPSSEWREQFKPWLEKMKTWRDEKPLIYNKDAQSIMPQPLLKKSVI